jgi:hypothetical protein
MRLLKKDWSATSEYPQNVEYDDLVAFKGWSLHWKNIGGYNKQPRFAVAAARGYGLTKSIPKIAKPNLQVHVRD